MPWGACFCGVMVCKCMTLVWVDHLEPEWGEPFDTPPNDIWGIKKDKPVRGFGGRYKAGDGERTTPFIYFKDGD